MSDWKSSATQVTGAGISLSSVRDMMSEIMGDYLHFTTTGDGNEGGTTLVDSALSAYGDNYFGGANNSRYVYITSGDAEGEERIISGFTSSSGTITVSAAFSAQIVSDVTYEIHSYSIGDKKRAINLALWDAFPYYYKLVEDTSLEPQGADDNEYDIPATFDIEFPSQIWLVKTDTDTGKVTHTRVDPREIRFRKISGNRKFYASLSEDDETVIWLIGKTHLTQFTTDTSETDLDTNDQMRIICYKAISNLYKFETVKINGQDYQRLQDLANEFEGRFLNGIRQNPMPSLIDQIAEDFSWER